MKLISGAVSRIPGLTGRRVKVDKQAARQERRISAALREQEVQRERGRAEGRGF